MKIRALVGELADVLDAEFPKFVIEEDKSLRYKQMIIMSQPGADKSSPEHGSSQALASAGLGADMMHQQDGQASQDVLERRHNQPKQKFFPFDDELSYNFYKVFPDLSEYIISNEEATEIMRIEKLDNQELLEEEIKQIQAIQEQQEREGRQPDAMPEEAELKERVESRRKRTIA